MEIIAKKFLEEKLGYKIHGFSIDDVIVNGVFVGLSIRVHPVERVDEINIGGNIIEEDMWKDGIDDVIFSHFGRDNEI